MTGQVIHFQSHRDLKRGQLYREQAVPRRAAPVRQVNDPSRSVRSQADFEPATRNARSLELQVARIAHLLKELEDLAQTSDNFPPALLGQTHAGIERARWILQPWARSESSADLENDIEGDPQPDVDGEKLERMYRDLNPDA
jgi:hypothetical protein